MNYRTYGLVAAVLAMLLLAGCFSSPSGKQAATLVAAATAPQPGEKISDVPLAMTESPHQVSPVIAPPSSPSSSAEPVNGNGEPSTKEMVETEKADSAQNDVTKAIEADSAKQEQSSSPKATNTDPPAINGNPKDEVTVTAESDAVKEKYLSQLNQLKTYYTGQLEDLYQQAITATKNSQSSNDVSNLYFQKAIALEEDSQTKVNGLLQQMKNELVADHLPVDSVEELRTAYYVELSKTKESFLAKARTDLGLKGM